MRVNKLKLAALAMSAITCVTSVPNVTFAEDFAAAFSSGAETEVAFAGDEDATFEADVDAVAGDDGFNFLFDSGEVGADNPVIDLVREGEYAVRFYYDDDINNYPDGTVVYYEINLETNALVTEADGETPKKNVLEGVATVTNQKDADCENPARFQYTYTIPGYEKYPDLLSDEFAVADSKPLGHDWVALENMTVVVYPDCTKGEEDGVGKGYQDSRCSRCGKLMSEVDPSITEEENLVDLPIEHSWGPEYTVVENLVYCHEENGEYVADDTSKLAYYDIYTYHDCQLCADINPADGKKQNVLDEDGNPVWDRIYVNVPAEPVIEFPSYSNIQDDFELDYPVTLTDEEIPLKDCSKPGIYAIVYYGKDQDGDGEPDILSYEEVTVAPHHMPGEIRVIAADGKRWESNTGEMSPAAEEGGEEGIDELLVTWDEKTGKVKSVVSKSCWESFQYSIIQYCDIVGADAEKPHIYSSQKDLTAAPAGPHSIDVPVRDLLAELPNPTTFEDIDEIVNPVLYDEDDTNDADVNKYVKLTTTATCTEAGKVTATYYCKVCNAEVTSISYNVKALEHKEAKPIAENYVAPTCTKDGGFDSVVYCERCKVEISRKPVVLAKLNHNYADTDKNVVIEWAGERVIDENGEYLKKYANKPEAFKVKGNKIRPDADNKQEDTFVKAALYDVCTRCGEKAEKEYTKGAENVIITVNSVTKQGGRYCEEGIINLSASYKKANGSVIELPAANFAYYETVRTFQGRTPHQAGEPVEENIVEGTEEVGRTYDRVIYCELCNYEMSRTSLQDAPNPHVHQMRLVEKEEATCETEGHEAYYVCDTPTCEGKLYDAEENQITWEEIVIPAGHKAELVEAVPATCVENGTKAYYLCSVCEKLFADEECTTELTKEDIVDEATGEHTPGEPVIENLVEAEPFTSGSMDSVVYCEVCGEEISRDTVEIDALRKPYATAVTGLHSNIYPEDETARIYFDAKDDVDDYRINYRIAGTGSEGYDAVDGGRVRTDGSNDYVVSGLKKGALYDFRVAAGNYVDGDENDVVWGTRSGYNRRWMQTVETVNIKAGTGSITVQWVEPTSATPSQYVVYYAPNKDMSGQKAVTVKGGTNTVTISGLEAGTKYYVRIRPYAKYNKATYSGSLSNRVAAKVK